jgi:hypothetical protein
MRSFRFIQEVCSHGFIAIGLFFYRISMLVFSRLLLKITDKIVAIQQKG